MAEEAVVRKETEEAEEDMESRIKDAMRSRVNHFKQQADSLTFEGVRRLMEKDMGLEKYALDVHKRFVKQCLFECLDGAVDGNASKDSGETGEKHVISVRGEAAESPGAPESKNNIKEQFSEDDEKMEDSPVMGLLTGQETIKSKTEETQANENKEVPSESSIKKAIWKRASYIKANSEKVSMAGMRRLLEEDLKLDKFTLDSHKKFISNQVEQVLKSNEVSEPRKNELKKKSHGKASQKVSSEESLDSSDKESDEDEVKQKKKSSLEKKIRNSERSTKRKRPEKETKGPGKKRSKPVETVADSNSDPEDSGNASEDSHSQSSEKPVKKKEAPAYGKHVENLKSVIKSCGMSVPPAAYKKVKQVPENKREAQLIKELEEILSKEGLSSNPSEKEIKEVRKRKERAKELEGIDTSNIVSTSRRRSTVSFVAPPRPKSDGDDADADDSGEDDDNNDDDDNDDDDGDNDSQSEEIDEEQEDSD